MTSRRILVRGALILAVSGCNMGCGHRDPHCDPAMSREQCAWVKASEPPKSEEFAPGEDPESPTVSPKHAQWGGLDELFEDVIAVMAAGMDRDVIETKALAWCESEPRRAEDPKTPRWVCDPRDPPALGVRTTLEVGAGVVTLSATDLRDEQSAALLKRVREHWHRWCSTGSFTALDAPVHQEFHRCALPGGPIFVVGRFPRDFAADRWQVSVAVMAAT